VALKVIIEDGRGNGSLGRVTTRGELVVNRFDYSTAYNATAGTANTAVNFVGPIASQQFVITDILLYANKNVGAADATVVIYEASSDSTATVDKTLFTTEMIKQSRADLVGLNLIVAEGKWVNMKTDDDDVFGTIMGYYVDAQ
jgi:FlaG/FlaF family flagellin (archaellin)